MVISSDRSKPLLSLLAIAATILLANAAIYAEIRILSGTLREGGIVETAQALLLLFSAAAFFVGGFLQSNRRGYLVLIASLFLCMFVRENDGYLDQIYHGFWAVPVGIIVFLAALFVIRNRATLPAPFLAHANTGPFWIIAIGFIQLIFFSRLFGSGLLWDHTAIEAGSDVAKRIVQEGTELLSYALICLGSVLSLRSRFGS